MKFQGTLGAVAVTVGALFWATRDAPTVAQDLGDPAEPALAGESAAVDPAAAPTGARPQLGAAADGLGGGGAAPPGPEAAAFSGGRGGGRGGSGTAGGYGGMIGGGGSWSGRMPASSRPVGMMSLMGSASGIRSYGSDMSAMPEAESEELQRLRSVDMDLQGEEDDLYRTFLASEGAARDALRERLADVVRRRFESKQRIRDRQITELEEQVKQLRELYRRREEAKDKIVGTRLDQLNSTAEGLGWEENAEGSAGAGASDPFGSADRQ